MAIKITDLFDFSDDAPIEKVIAQMEKLNSIYETLVSSAQKNSQKYADSLNMVLESVDELESAYSKLDATSKKDQDQIAKSAAAMEELAHDNVKYTNSLKDTEEQISMLIDQQKKLTSAKEKLKEANVGEIGSLADLRKELKDAEADYLKMGTAIDQAIKEKALNNIKELAKAVNAGNDALKAAKKGVDVATGSYNELVQKVAAATKQLRAMEGGIGSTSKQFKDLQKTVKDGNAELAKFDEEIGINTRHVGGYKEEIEKLIPSLKAINPHLVEMGEGLAGIAKKGMALLLSPIGLILGTIAAAAAIATKSVELFTETTFEGSEKANLAMSRFRVTGALLKSEFKDLGKTIFNAINPKENEPNFIDKFIVASLRARGALAAAAVYEKKARDLGDKMLEQARLQNEIRKEEISLTIELAKLELEKDRELFVSRDTLFHTIQERYAATIKGGKISDEQTRLEIASIDKQIESIRILTKVKKGESVLDLLKSKNLEDIARLQASSPDIIEKIADLEAKRYQAQANAFNEAKARQKIEIQLVEQALATRLKLEKEFDQSLRTLDKAFLDERQAYANTIIGYQKYSDEEQLESSKDYFAAALEELKHAKEQQEAVALDAARQRVVLTAETNRKIFEQAGGDLDLRTRLLDEAQRKEIEKDKTFLDEVVAIGKDHANKQQEVLRQATISAAKIIDDRYQYFINLEKQGSKELFEEEQINLLRRFEGGKISLKKYNREKEALLKLQADKEFAIQIDELNRELRDLELFYLKKGGITKEGEERISRITGQISELRYRREQAKQERALTLEAQYQAKLQELKQAAIDGVLAVGENLFAKEQEQEQAKIDRLNTQRENELQLAGDNAAAKAQIETDYAKKIIDVQRELRESQRKQAIFEKALAVANIGIHTAEGIAKALGEYGPAGIPLAIAIGAIGAIQLAVAISKPIPQFFKGTESSPEGLAVVGEKGRELAIDPSGSAKMYDKPQITYLKKGTRIFNNEDTEKITAQLATDSLLSSQKNDVTLLSLNRDEGRTAQEMRAVGNKIDDLTYTVRTKKEFHFNEKKIADAIKRGLINRDWIKQTYK